MKFCESSFFQVKKKHGRWVRAFSLGKLVSLDCWNEGAVVPGTCSFCEFRMRPVSYKHIFKIGYICNVPVFDAAFLPILKDFAEITGSRLKIQQDPWHDITATFSSQCGIDITPSEKRMRMIISAADHISINKQTDSDRVDFSLIFGFPDDAE
ncbi:Uncharacterised protein [uncultured Clostridium sp.]|nr:hypothetical protein [Clostridium sp. MCC344]MBS7000133.1 hypothetical protein [Clostridiaceae bacterium]MBT9790795.1 hypothetical protein [Clostridium sp. MCC344]SCJ23185.1 Uncharacterised protein [uncultured Clostridium sp.]